MALTRQDLVARGLKAFAARAWRDAYDCFVRADRRAPLEPAVLDQAAMAAHLSGRDAEGIDLLARAHQAHLGANEPARAVRCAFWLTFAMIDRGDMASASGWLARARRLLEACGRDCVEQGYLLLPVARDHVAQGRTDEALVLFAEAASIGERFGEADLVNLARQGHGRALIRLGDVERGMALLDEVMIAVTADELSPIIAGNVYCSVISACMEAFDLRRAREWTEALARWCAAQPDLFPFRGQCLVYRAEVMTLGGGWTDAIEQARAACGHLTGSPNRGASGAAFYQLAELCRLRGDAAGAEDAYRRASEQGRSPQPGLALLRLAQGRVGDARAAMCRVVGELRDPAARAGALAAYVEILLEAGDKAAARASADELWAVAAEVRRPIVDAKAARAAGAVLLAEGDATRALGRLRESLERWRALGVPYEAARTTVLIGLACRALGDADTADMELASARRVFDELNATPDLARMQRLSVPGAEPASGLTSREMQVLRVLAKGKTNRAIANELAISEKTVARHIANIFTKLDISSRAAATAFAFQHRLV